MDRNNYIEIHPTQAQVAKISYHHPSKYLNHHDTHDHTVKIWSSFLNLYRFMTLEIHEFSYIEDIFEKYKGCVNDFLALGSLGRKDFHSVTHYISSLTVYHISEEEDEVHQ
jgi:hypothetical protein